MSTVRYCVRPKDYIGCYSALHLCLCSYSLLPCALVVIKYLCPDPDSSTLSRSRNVIETVRFKTQQHPHQPHTTGDLYWTVLSLRLTWMQSRRSGVVSIRVKYEYSTTIAMASWRGYANMLLGRIQYIGKAYACNKQVQTPSKVLVHQSTPSSCLYAIYLSMLQLSGVNVQSPLKQFHRTC